MPFNHEDNILIKKTLCMF